MIDLSGSTEFGSARSKKDLLLEVSSVFLYLAQMNNDRMSVLLFTDRVEKFLRPRKGRKYILKVLDEILKCEPQSRGTDISAAVDFLQRVLKKRSVVFVISDFLDPNPGFLLKMKLLGRKHDIIPVIVSDPFESRMAIPCFSEFVDLETGKVFYSDAMPDRGAAIGIPEFDAVHLSTAESIEVPILKYFEKRNRRHARAV